MILWKPKVLHYGWWDVDHYEAYRQKRIAECTEPAPALQPSPAATRAKRRTAWKTLEEGSPALSLLRYLDSYQREHGEMPTNTEIARLYFGNSPKTGYVSYCLSALEHGGWITRQFNKPRSIKITPAGRASLQERAEVAEKVLVS